MHHLARRSPPLPHMTSQMCAWGPEFHDKVGRRFGGNEEPSVAELLCDPMMARLLASDGVASEDLATLVARTRERLGA